MEEIAALAQSVWRVGCQCWASIPQSNRYQEPEAITAIPKGGGEWVYVALPLIEKGSATPFFFPDSIHQGDLNEAVLLLGGGFTVTVHFSL